jgi:hypothetical protein
MKKLLLMALALLSVPAFAQKLVKNGILYKEHPYIDVVKKCQVMFKAGDFAALSKVFADTAKFSENGDPKWRTLKAVKKDWQKTRADWNTVSIKQIGYPNGMEFIKQPFTVESYWRVTSINRKTKKTAIFTIVQFDEFNKAGKIGREYESYDTASLIAASK